MYSQNLATNNYILDRLSKTQEQISYQSSSKDITQLLTRGNILKRLTSIILTGVYFLPSLVLNLLFAGIIFIIVLVGIAIELLLVPIMLLGRLLRLVIIGRGRKTKQTFTYLPFHITMYTRKNGHLRLVSLWDRYNNFNI